MTEQNQTHQQHAERPSTGAIRHDETRFDAAAFAQYCLEKSTCTPDGIERAAYQHVREFVIRERPSRSRILHMLTGWKQTQITFARHLTAQGYAQDLIDDYVRRAAIYEALWRVLMAEADPSSHTTEQGTTQEAQPEPTGVAV